MTREEAHAILKSEYDADAAPVVAPEGVKAVVDAATPALALVAEKLRNEDEEPAQAALDAAGEGAWVESHDHLVFHLGSSPKFVKHAFEHALAAARGGHSGGGGIKHASSVAAALSEAEVAARFERQVAPSLRLAARIGPSTALHTWVVADRQGLASLKLAATDSAARNFESDANTDEVA